MLRIKKKGIILIFLLAFLLSNNKYLVSAQDMSYEADLEYIITQYLLGNYENVIILLTRHFSDSKKELAYLYGLCYLRLNMNKIALEYFNIALAEHENNYEILNNIGVAYFKENDFVNAMKYFHLSFISNTDYLIAQQNYNEAYDSWVSERNNELKSAMIPFTEKSTIYNSLGIFYYYSGDFHNAIYYLKKAIEEDINFQFAYITLAYLYIEGNNYETALNYLLEAEKIDLNNPDIYNNLGIVYYNLFDYERSEKAFRKAILLNHKFAEPHNNLGFLFFYKSEYSLSEEYFKKSLEINLNNQELRAESLAGLAIINAKNGNFDLSKDYKEYSIKLNYKMNDIRYLTNILKWSYEIIEIWDKI
jgi:tetratricopeptide (TPR) repeat protein